VLMLLGDGLLYALWAALWKAGKSRHGYGQYFAFVLKA
jgi:hypothetical protein